MAAVVGYLVAATIATAAVLFVAGPRNRGRRDPTFEPVDVAGRQVGVLSALGGFALTAIVFLVTQARNVPDPTGTSFTTVLAMFVVAWMGYFSSSVLFAQVSHRAEDATFDLAAAQYAGASITFFGVFIGWFALRPLFQTFGLTPIADLVSWLLVGAVVVGYGILANALYRTGYATARLTLVMPALAVAGCLGYWLVVAAIVPDLRSVESTLALTITAFLLGVPAYLALTTLPIAANRDDLAPVLAGRWHLALLGYTEAALVLVGFLLLAVLGLI